jgi:hypothetical protein
MFRKLWTQVISNLDSSIAIVISIFAAFYGLFNNDSPLLAAISGALGLVAYGMIKEDRDAYISFKDLTASAHRIYLVGPTLVTLFNRFSDYFRDTKLRGHGATIQAIILNPQSSAVESAANCLDQPLDKIKAEIEDTMASVS